MFTDSHAHIVKEYYENIDEIVQKAKENDVNKIILAATKLSDAKEIIEYANKFENIFICLGIHPEEVGDSKKNMEELIRANIVNKKLIAIGEIGLDYYYTKENKAEQIDLFESQLKLAEELNLPAVVHSREATLDTINCLKKYKVRGVIHCFSGSLEIAKEYIKMGFYIGVGGVMTFKNSKIDEIIKEIPLEKIVLETDAPFLTPEPYRKYQNEPKYIKNIAEYLAKIKNISLEKVSEITEKNIKDIFDI